LGIITERDVVRILGKLDPNLLQAPLGELMTKPLITIEQSVSIYDATKIMNDKKIRRLVVMDQNNKMIGILTQRDIFKAIDKDPDLFSEFYGNAFSSKFKSIYEKYNKYSLED
jgi:predicted transcriptional regulator